MAGKNYKITYFNITALGEPLRFMLAYAGKEFEDVRVEKDDWPAMKPTTPFGKLPVVEVDGKVLHQTKPILRWVAKSVGLAGDNDWEDLQIGIAADTIDDIRMPLAMYFYEAHEGAKAQRKEPLFKEALPFALGRLDAHVKANGGYLANGKLSWADLYFASLVQYLSFMAGTDNIVAKYPNLQALHDKVFALPKIAAYVAKRPKTPIAIDDLRQAFFRYFTEQNDATKKTKLETLVKETVPLYMTKVEALAKENGEYLANGKISWADFYLYKLFKSRSN